MPSGAVIISVITATGVRMATLKVTKIGNSLGVILPKEVAARLKKEGKPEIAITPMSMVYAVIGIFFRRPPIRVISCTWWQP